MQKRTNASGTARAAAWRQALMRRARASEGTSKPVRLATVTEPGHNGVSPFVGRHSQQEPGIKRPVRMRRRRSAPSAAVQTMPAWKRILCAGCFMVGGSGAAAWGIYDIVAWIGSLHQGKGLIETESFLLGLPLLGAGLCAIGPEFIVPRTVATWSDRVRTRIAGAVLGSIAIGILLVLLGQLVINVAMESEGYHACDVQGRGRVTVVTWARAYAACRGKGADRQPSNAGP